MSPMLVSITTDSIAGLTRLIRAGADEEECVDYLLLLGSARQGQLTH